jgi:hypothetical protein
MAFERGRFFMLAAALAGASLACGSAQGQEDGGGVEERIETAFDLVPENAIDLAVPLTRRALAQRASDMGGLMPLGRAKGLVRMDASAEPSATAGSSAAHAYVAAGGEEPSKTAALAARAMDAKASLEPELAPGESEPEFAEQGSAEGEADEDVRLPRPRPATRQLAASPLDLVAGAALADSDSAAAELDVAELDGRTAVVAATPPETTASLPHQAVAVLPAPPTDTTARASEDAAASKETPEKTLRPASAELLASAECLAADGVSDKDGDFRRNAAALAAPGLCIAEQKFKERRRPWTIQTVSSGRPGPLWAVLHDDEDVAFDSAVRALTTYGGTPWSPWIRAASATRTASIRTATFPARAWAARSWAIPPRRNSRPRSRSCSSPGSRSSRCTTISTAMSRPAASATFR